MEGLDPFSESVFLFCNRKKGAIKVLHFDLNGFELLTKKLLESKYQWPKSKEEAMAIGGTIHRTEASIQRNLETHILTKNVEY